ncbi:MAG: hypothetical protein PHC50_06570 [Candidatus Cloacimonetes bacterium]|nr:hypothetical protein [Candidatus Cloacimonadota bacterium]
MRLILFVILLLVSCLSFYAIEVPFSTVPVKTDDNLFESFVRIDPDDRKEESLPTRVWLWYDVDNLYIEFNATIDSTFCKGEFAPRDTRANGDYLRIQIITIPEAYYAYYYVFSATGTLSDGIRNSDCTVDYNWNSTYSYTADYSDSLLRIVAKLPFKDMRFNAKPPYQWKIILSRYHQQNQEMYSSPYSNVNELRYYFSQSYDVSMSNPINRASGWTFRPYIVKSYDLINRTESFEPENLGMDISFNPSSKTKLKVTINPDFTDVPQDDAQNIYNSKYPPYYAENRFFFIEDLDAFGVSSSLFNTRLITQPQYALKFTGNTNTLNYGILCARDKKIQIGDSIVNNDDYYQLASFIKIQHRYRFILSSLSRLNTGYYNQIVSSRLDWELIRKLQIGAEYIHSWRHEENNYSNIKGDKQGDFFNCDLTANPDNWMINAKYNYIGKDLRIDTGTIYDTGFENYGLNISWNSKPQENRLRSWGFYCSGDYITHLDQHKSLKYETVGASSWLEFYSKLTLSGGSTYSREYYQGHTHDQYFANVGFNWYKWDLCNLSSNVIVGNGLIYSINQTSPYLMTSLKFSGIVSQSLKWSLDVADYMYNYQRVYFIPPDNYTIQLDNHYQIIAAKLIYNINNQMSIRNGLSITTYESYGSFSNLSFYTNYSYELRKDWFIFLGFQTNQWQDEKSLYHDPLGHFVRDQANCYFKLSITI